MKKEITICDLCGSVLKDPIHLSLPSRIERETGGHKIEFCWINQHYDFCPGCVEELLNYIVSWKKLTKERKDIFGSTYDLEIIYTQEGHPDASNNDSIKFIQDYIKKFKKVHKEKD